MKFFINVDGSNFACGPIKFRKFRAKEQTPGIHDEKCETD